MAALDAFGTDGDLCKGKQEWPELVGVRGSMAKRVIETENPNVEAVYIWCGAPRIENFRCDRVWLDVTRVSSGNYEEAAVCKTPVVG